MIKQTTPTRVGRIDGPLKVSGVAKYTSDFNFPRLAYAVPVGATTGKGRVKSIDLAAAKKTKGVLGVYTRENIGPLFRPTPEAGFEFKTDEPRPPFEDDEIRYYGQYIAVVVAETFEIAQNAARSITATYAVEKPNLDENYRPEDMKKTDVERGHAAESFASAPVKVDQTYVTPPEVHVPIEMHATVAVWEGPENVTLYETTQASGTHQNVLAQVLGLPRENVRVVSKFLGSGFGGKLWAWPHSTLAAATARLLRRPVKLVIDRRMSFTNVGHRPRTQQRIQLAAGKDGKLKSLQHDYVTQAAFLADYKENCGEVSGFLYDIPDVRVTSGVARRNQGCPTSMRGPGAVPGLFALESALDELALALKMDPVDLRLKNDTLVDRLANKPFSSRHLKECLTLGAEKFGWSRRDPKIGSMRDGDEILGWGMASCTWQSQRLDAEATFRFRRDGKVVISTSAHDIGTGTYTVLAEIVRRETGIGFDRIEVELGDTNLPRGPLSGGSMATGSLVPAVTQAVRKAVSSLKTSAIKLPTSPMFGKKEDEVTFENGKLNGVDFAKLLAKFNVHAVEGRGKSAGDMGQKDKAEFSTKSFGAHFVEVGWTPGLARLRVRRVNTVVDGGKILNFQPARNQVEGAVVMGVGMALFEEMSYDPRDGFVANDNLADYVVAVHADCPAIDVSFLDFADPVTNEYGLRGIGEIGLAGVAAAITNGVHHATGIRVRELPVTIEKLLV